MKRPIRSIFSRWLPLGLALQAAASGYAATNSPMPAPTQSAVAAAASSSPIHESPIARTANGMLSGEIEDGVTAFRGIPFAAPPVGRLRWREPQPAALWEGASRRSG